MNSSRPERLLRAGVDFTNRGELKYARAVHLANELRGRIDEWSAAETLLARVHQPDAHTVEFRLVIRREPPIEEWSLILGDALHNLRTAFDNVVWALATLDGATPHQPKQVTFPITRDETHWRQRVRTLESIPVDLLDRLRSLQPWVDGVGLDESLLGLLHSLDITDKHRGLIASSLHLKRLLLAGIDLGLKTVDAVDEGMLTYSTRKTPVPIENDAVLTTIHSQTRELHPDPDYLAKVDVQFALAADANRILLLDSFMHDLVDRTREWLDRIYGGETYLKGLIASRQATSASVSFGYLDEQGTPHITQLPMVDPVQGTAASQKSETVSGDQ